MGTIIYVPKQFMPDPRDPPVADPYPPASSIQRAKAAMLCDRGDLLDTCEDREEHDRMLSAMDRPTLLDLQLEESKRAERVAVEAAYAIYQDPLKLLPLETRVRLREAAIVLCRSQHAAWRSKAISEAVLVVTTALVEELGKALPQLTRPHWHGLAARLTGLVTAKVKDVLLTSQDDQAIPPGQYLTLAGASLAEDAEVTRQVEAV